MAIIPSNLSIHFTVFNLRLSPVPTVVCYRSERNYKNSGQVTSENVSPTNGFYTFTWTFQVVSDSRAGPTLFERSLIVGELYKTRIKFNIQFTGSKMQYVQYNALLEREY